MNGEVDRDMTHHFQRDPPLCLHWNSPGMGARSNLKKYNLEDAFEGLSIMRKKVRFEEESMGDTRAEKSTDNSTAGSKEEMKDVIEENIEEMEERGEEWGEERGGERGGERKVKKRPFMSVPARVGNMAPLSLYGPTSNRNLFKPLSKKRQKVYLGLSPVMHLNGGK